MRPEASKGTRVGMRRSKDGKTVSACRASSGEVVGSRKSAMADDAPSGRTKGDAEHGARARRRREGRQGRRQGRQGAEGRAKAAKATKARPRRRAAGADASRATKARPQRPCRRRASRSTTRRRSLPELMKRFGYTNPMQAPRLTRSWSTWASARRSRTRSCSTRPRSSSARSPARSPSVRKAKKSIANFKLREGQPIGCMVTLRGARMYEFYDRLVNIAIPRIRDFRGVPTRSFDGRGNYTLGLTEQIIFPEINYDKVEKVRGMDVTIVTTAKTDEEGRELLRSADAVPPAGCRQSQCAAVAAGAGA